MMISIVGLGGVAVLVSILRLIVLREFQTSSDFTYTLGKMIIISSIEIEVAIIAANGPSLKALWSKHVTKTRYTSQNQYSITHELSKMSSLDPRRQKLPSESSSNNFSMGQHVQCKGEASMGKWQNDSQEKLFKNYAGILVTSTVGVETYDMTNPDPAKLYNKFGKL
jgi:hypothetical protein